MPGNKCHLICSPWAGGVTPSRCFQESGKDGWYFQVSRARRAVADLCFGLACRSGCEIKELTPLAEGPTSGNRDPSAHCQQRCCCSMRLQYTQSEPTMQQGGNVHHHTSLEDCLGPPSHGWTGCGLVLLKQDSCKEVWKGSSTAVWGCEKGQQHMGAGGWGWAVQVTLTFCCRGKYRKAYTRAGKSRGRQHMLNLISSGMGGWYSKHPGFHQ